MANEDLEFIELNMDDSSEGYEAEDNCVEDAGAEGVLNVAADNDTTDSGSTDISDDLPGKRQGDQNQPAKRKPKQILIYDDGQDAEDKSKESKIKIDYLHIAISAILIIALGLLFFAHNSIVESMPEQNAYKLWDRGLSGQISIFISEEAKADTVVVGRIKNSLIKAYNKILGSSTYNEKDIDNGPYFSSYCTMGNVSVGSDVSEESSFTVIGVGGDYFTIHRPTLLTGDYLYADSSDNLVLLDSLSAFKLFGSIDVVGEEITVNKVPHYICGVYAIDDSRMSVKAGSDSGYMYMTYNSLDRVSKITGITCVELVGNNPSEDFLITSVKEAGIGISDDLVEYVQNDTRFGVKHVLDTITDFPINVMRKSKVILPFWENIARGYEIICAMILIAQAIIIAVLLIRFFIDINRLMKSNLISAKRIGDWWYDKSMKRRKHRKRHK